MNIAIRMIVLFLGLLLAGCSAQYAPQQFRLAREEIKVPLRYEDDSFLLQATVNGMGPFTLLLDTGASATTFSSDLVRTLHLEKTASYDLSTTPFGTLVNVERVAINSLDLNGAEFRNISAQVAVNEELFTHRPYKGILGFSTFSSLAWIFDGPGRQLILRTSLRSPPPANDFLPLDAVHSLPQWPVRISHGRAIVPMSVAGAPKDSHIDVVLDTGCVWDFLLPAYLQIQLPELPLNLRGEMLSASGSHPLNASMLAGSLTIGRHNFHLPLVAYVPSPNGLAAVGAPILKDFVITFDMPSARVWMQRPTRATPVTASR